MRSLVRNHLGMTLVRQHSVREHSHFFFSVQRLWDRIATPHAGLSRPTVQGVLDEDFQKSQEGIALARFRKFTFSCWRNNASFFQEGVVFADVPHFHGKGEGGEISYRAWIYNPHCSFQAGYYVTPLGLYENRRCDHEGRVEKMCYDFMTFY